MEYQTDVMCDLSDKIPVSALAADIEVVEKLAERLQSIIEWSDPSDPVELWATLPEFRRDRVRHWVCDFLEELGRITPQIGWCRAP